MPYKTWATGNVLNAADLNAMTADASQADLVSAQTTTSTTYTNLATSGPAVTLTLVAGQGALVFVSAYMGNTSTADITFMGFEVSGAEADAAADVDAAANGAGDDMVVTRQIWYVAGTTGSHTFTCKYRVTGGTGRYDNRRITVKKF